MNNKRDHKYRKRDRDLDYDQLPGCSRFIFEVEYAHRTVIPIRQLGYNYMVQDPDARYMRSFCAERIKEGGQGGFELAIVIWRKNPADEGNIIVSQAISCGSIDLSTELRQEFQQQAERDLRETDEVNSQMGQGVQELQSNPQEYDLPQHLPPVKDGQWFRPSSANIATFRDCESWSSMPDEQARGMETIHSV